MRRSSALLWVVLAACEPSAATVQSSPTTSRAPPYAPTRGLTGDVTVVFSYPRPGTQPIPRFYGMPWPSELWRRPDGKLDFSSFPARDSLLVGQAVRESAAAIAAFSVNPVVYFHCTGAIDPGRLPAPAGTLQPDTSIALLDVDPSSPARGRPVPLEYRYYDTDQRYVPAFTLALKPLAGFVLRPSTLYAAVVRRSLTDPPLGTARDFELTKWERPQRDPVRERARRLHAPVLDLLAKRGVARSEIAALAVFRTQDPARVLRNMIAVVDELPRSQAPRVLAAEWLPDAAPETPYQLIRGYYCTPNFQQGVDSAPFQKQGGTVVLDSAGRPQLQPIGPESAYRTQGCGDLLRARFVLTVPRGPMPDRGWPLLVVAHGTTGDAFSFTMGNDFALWAARAGIAAVSTDQPLHGGLDPIGARPGSRTPFQVTFGGIPIRIPHEGRGSEMAFYNLLRPPVLRDNVHQATIDSVVLSRLMLATDFATLRTAAGDAMLPPTADGPAPRFQRERLLLGGHSQGSQCIALQAAVDPLARGVVLSGSGGDIRLSFTRRRDTDGLAVVNLLLGLSDGELDEFHPLLSLVQTVIDPVDPLSYAHLYRERPATEPLSALHFEGIGDTMTVGEVAEALAVALHAQPLAPMQRPVPGLDLLGITARSTVRGNAAKGRATIALVQLTPTLGEDGHFVMHNEPAGAQLVQQFLGELARGDTPPAVGPLELGE